uniref:Uncharacterized protein n=1 Tax=Anguilla anguilla TaxID=7936 RepID=A0A0E9SE28_ANGAN
MVLHLVQVCAMTLEGFLGSRRLISAQEI